MSDFDYGNARLRVMKSRLLSRRELETLAEASNLQSLTVALIKTPYRKAIETALARTTGMDCITEALRNDLIDTALKIRQFYSETASELVASVLRTYDIHNIKAILRGLGRNVPLGEIYTTLLPIGDISYSLLVEIAHASGPRLAIDLIAILNLPIAQPLLKLRGERPGAETPEMELALDQWYFRETVKKLDAQTHDDELLQSALKLDADITNLLTVLRFVHAPAERRLLRDRFSTEQFTTLLVGPGRIPFAALGRAADENTLAGAVASLAKPPYHTTLQAGLEAFSKSGRLSDFESQLQRFRLKWMSQWITKDPLGIGVLLGYLALKGNEIRDLRWISKGINLGLNKENLRAELVGGSFVGIL